MKAAPSTHSVARTADERGIPADAAVYVELPLAEPERDRVRTLTTGPVWFAEPGTRAEEDVRALAAADIALGNPRAELLAEASRLRWLQLASVGVDAYLGLDWPALGRRLTVTNLSGLSADPVAESCLAGVLALYRGMDELGHLRERGTWATPTIRPRLRLLTGAQVLILGRGSIARRLAELLAPFGCAVSHFARSDGDLRTLDDLDRNLPSFDVVVGLLPDTEQTRGLFDAERLGRLRPDAVFVNAGRGTLVYEDALVAALAAGRLGGAVLDVTREEPLPAGHPLWNCPRVILTQHTAAGHDRETGRVIDVFADNWRRYQAGDTLRNVVQWGRGY